MIVLDTSALLRFFTTDDEQKARKAAVLLEEERDLVIPDAVCPELEYVLTSAMYDSTRQKVSGVFRALISRRNISVSNSVLGTVEIYERTNLDMADCIIAASAAGGRLASFDGELRAIGGRGQALGVCELVLCNLSLFDEYDDSENRARGLGGISGRTDDSQERVFNSEERRYFLDSDQHGSDEKT